MECDRDGNTHIVIGQDAVMFSIGPKGEWLGSAFLQTEIIGPDGERNWHPDAELEGEETALRVTLRSQSG